MAGSICDVLPSAAALLGVQELPDRLRLGDLVGDVRRVLVLLVDGMGYHLLPRLAPHAPLLASAQAVAGRLECTFPSTTPTSLASLGTGVMPGEHGVLGFTLNVPGTERVLTHIFWRDDPPPAQWAPVATVFARMAHAGIATRAVLPAAFVDSGLTAAVYGGATLRAAPSDQDYASIVSAELRATRGLVYAYTSALDTAAHQHGIASTEWAQAAADVDRLVARLLEDLPADAALVVTADHGGLDVPRDSRVDIDADQRLAAGIRVVAGEPRVRYLHTVEGAAPDVLDTWRALVGERADVLARDEAIDTGWFGPVPDAHRARIGDVVIVCTDVFAVMASAREPEQVTRLIGFHGARSDVEMAIPLLTWRR